MSNETAYQTNDPTVIQAWEKYLTDVSEVKGRRDALVTRYGRNLMVQGRGFGHGTRVVGFQILDGEPDGLVIGDNGELRIPKTGPPYNAATPNLRRKAGKDLAAELRTLNTPEPDLPGMPKFHIYGDQGIRSAAPALWAHTVVFTPKRRSVTIYALWPCDNAPVADNWETIPLSTYYLALERHEAGQEGPI